MSINAGTAMGYLDLDIKGFQNGIKAATQQLDIFNNNTATSGQKMEALGGVMKSAGANLTKFVSVPLLGVGALSIKTAGDFQAGMSKVQAISGATSEDMKKLENMAKDMGATTKFSARDAADALSYMGMAGWKTEDMMNGLPGILDLAAAGGTDLALTSDIVTDGLTGLGLTAKDTGMFVDIMAATCANSNTSVELMGETLKYVGPVAGTLGIEMDDLSVAIGLMGNAGIKGGQAGTALRAGLANLVKPTKEMQVAMNKYGVELVKNSDGSVDLMGTMENLRSTLGGLDQATQAQALATIFGKEAMSGWAAIVNASEGDFDKLTEAIANSEGKAKDMATTMQDNLKGSIDNLKSAFEGACIVIGERLIPMFQGVVEWLTDVLTWFNNLDEGTQTLIITIGGLVAAIGPLLMIGGTLLTMLPNMVAGFGMVKTATLALTGAITATPVAIGALVAAAVGLISIIGDNANAIDYLQDKFGVFGTFLGTLCEFIAGLVQLTFGNMIIIISTAAEAIGAILTGKFTKVDDIVKEGWAKVENNTAEAMSNIAVETSQGLALVKQSTEQELQGVVQTFDIAMKELPNLTRDNAGEMARVFTEQLTHLDNDSLTILRGTSDSMAVLFEGIRADMDSEQATKKFTANLESMATSGKFSADTLQQDIDKAMKLINENMLIEGEAFKQTATNVFNQFKTIGQQGASEMADNVVAELQGMDQETFIQLTSMGTTWSGIFSGISLDGSMNTQQMKDAILNNLNSMGIDGATLINQLRTESTNHMNNMSNEADKATKDMSSKVDANTKSAKDKASKNTKDLVIDVDKNTKDAKDKANTNTKGIATDTDTNTKKAASSASKNTAEGAKSVEQNMSKMAKDAKTNTSKVATDTDADFKKANKSIQQEATNMYNGAKQSFTKLAEIAKQAGTDMYNGVTNSASKMANNAKQSASDMYRGVTTSTRLMANNAISDWNRIRNAYSVPITGKINITKTTTEVKVQKEAPASLGKGIFNKDIYKRAMLANESLNTAFYSGQVANETTVSSIKKEIILKLKDNSKPREKEARNEEKKITINNTYNSPKPASIRDLKRQDEIQMRRLAMQLGF